MPQFFLDEPVKVGAKISIRGGDARHIVQSLRLAAGDWLVVSDGLGRSFRTTIETARPSEVIVVVGEEIATDVGATPPALAIAATRSERLEWAVQKAVELGCHRIVLYNSERTVRRIEGPATKKIERIRRIALEAAKQSGLPFVPKVEDPVEFAMLCTMLGEFDPRIMLYEGTGGSSMRDALSRSGTDVGEGIIVVGPEGGFTDAEVAAATSHAARIVSLGRQILRVETAAVTALAIYQYEIGNMGIG